MFVLGASVFVSTEDRLAEQSVMARVIESQRTVEAISCCGTTGPDRSKSASWACFTLRTGSRSRSSGPCATSCLPWTRARLSGSSDEMDRERARSCAWSRAFIGRPTGRWPSAAASRIGTMIELGVGFHPELTGSENVFLNAAVYGLSRAEIESLYGPIVEYSGLAAFMDVRSRTTRQAWSSGSHSPSPPI